MRAAQFDALVDAAGGERGVDFEGLRVSRDPEGGFRFETPAVTATGLSEAELHAHADGSPHVTNWYFWERDVKRRDSPRRAFLRRAEAADSRQVADRYDALRGGLVTEWGQLRIEATLSDHGARRYDLRHVDDADRGGSDLEAHEDPFDAREIATLDDDGRYRPLKTAPSLPSGWVFPSLDWHAVLEAVEAFYPVTVANWYREREGELDVSHWRETAERQTGIYDVIEELPRESVEHVASACCVDSQCLKRREWEYDEGDELAADGGTGAFPCREPCSLVVAASRKWTTLEREEEREFGISLTPSEAEQVGEIVDAVADGRVEEIREADVGEGANRYRARYLRAKHMGEDGTLDWTDGNETDS
ncbi:DR2241 family protein [Halorarum halobium]|uniref:DR2241 family protein n=1 Tax=Halorarum halobium TaxID=3075121 RepID=UPI0028AABEB3|nr:DR2241 family protein [Halobaculum sp. XH14]